MNVYFTTVKGRRISNEDRHNIITNINGNNKKYNNLNFFSIYDGHGGIFVSDFLKQNIPNYFCLNNIPIPFSNEFYVETFNTIQKDILKTNKKKGFSNGSTCLLNIMYYKNNDIFMDFVNVGDSRATIIYKNKKFKQITTDHKPDDVNENKRIKELNGVIYPDSDGVLRIGDLSLTRSFGDADHEPYVIQTPDIFNVKLTSDIKYVVMACDGLWDVINNNELYNLLSKSNIKNHAEMLANECLKRNTTDNVSIIVIEFE